MSAFPPAPGGLSPALAPLYDEATTIADDSPASACALLRLLIRAVVTGSGRPGRNLVTDIETATLGSPGVLRALDSIGMSPDHAKRPGEIDLGQGHSDVQNLLVLVTLVVTELGSSSP